MDYAADQLSVVLTREEILVAMDALREIKSQWLDVAKTSPSVLEHCTDQAAKCQAVYDRLRTVYRS